ncbi:MAG TPA: glycosyltransferase family 39 protein [Candidatus Polarisedimenticolia bacterium]|nr:glycosyltransferase family 39 protein [Candidatus Polarisedimenticolia bacterium]
MSRTRRTAPEPRTAGARGRHLLLVVAAAALLRAAYLLDYRAHSVFWDSLLLDAEVYDAMARSIAAGDWLAGTSVYTLPPLYPYALAALYALTGRSLGAVYVAQALLGVVNVVLIHSIGRKVFSGRAPLIASVLAVAYGSFMFTESKLMGTTLALTMGLALMRLMLLAGEKQTLTLWGGCGALLGLTALARPETLLLVPFAALWILRVTSRPDAARKAAPIDQYALAGRQPWFALSVFAAFVVIAVSPATLRNWVVSEDWSLANLISSQAGITFYQSNNPRSIGLYSFLQDEGFSGNPMVQAEEEKTIAEKAEGRPLKRSEVTRYWMGKGVSWIVSNPGPFLVLECKKLLRFLGSYEYSTEYILAVEREGVRTLWLAPLPFAAITALAVVGLLYQWREGFRPPAMLLTFFVAANLMAVLAFYVSSRYRMPSAPALILFAASGLDRLVTGFRSRASSSRVEAWLHAGIAALLFVLFHVQVDASHRVQEANAHYNAGNQHYNKKEYGLAVAEYERALAGDRRNWRAWYNMGNALNAAGRPREAVEAYRQALRINEGMEAARRQLRALGESP